MKKAAVIFAAILLVVVIVLSSVQSAAMSDSFFESQYQKNMVDQHTKIELTELMRITDEIQAYLFGVRADFLIEGTVAGEHRQLFNEREILHMVDVLYLFNSGLAIRNVAAGLLVVMLIFLWFRNRILPFQAMQISVIVLLSIAVVITILLLSDFDRYFVLFHELFFSNDLWILDPQTSILVNMVPTPFFMAIARLILIRSAVSVIVVGVVGLWGARIISSGRCRLY